MWQKIISTVYLTLRVSLQVTVAPSNCDSHFFSPQHCLRIVWTFWVFPFTMIWCCRSVFVCVKGKEYLLLLCCCINMNFFFSHLFCFILARFLSILIVLILSKISSSGSCSGIFSFLFGLCLFSRFVF